MSRPEKWTDNTTCQFVSLYKKHECLWNVKLPEYKNKNNRDRALQEIQDEMAIQGFGGNEIKNKIRSLRSTYYLEKKKINKLKTEGCSLYKSSLKWFHIMQDIMNTLGKQKYTNEASSTSNQPTSQQQTDEETLTQVKIEVESDDAASTGSGPDEIKTEICFSDHEITAPSTSAAEPPAKRQKTQIDDLNAKIDELKEIILNNNDNDECLVFGKYIGFQLQKMTYETRTLCQLNIQKLCSEALLNQIREGTSITVDVVQNMNN